jgi:hypothetical protein
VVLQAWSAEAEDAQAAEARTTRLLATSERPSERGSEPKPKLMSDNYNYRSTTIKISGF